MLIDTFPINTEWHSCYTFITLFCSHKAQSVSCTTHPMFLESLPDGSMGSVVVTSECVITLTGLWCFLCLSLLIFYITMLHNVISVTHLSLSQWFEPKSSLFCVSLPLFFFHQSSSPVNHLSHNLCFVVRRCRTAKIAKLQAQNTLRHKLVGPLFWLFSKFFEIVQL